MEGRYGHGGALCPFGFFPVVMERQLAFEPSGSRIM